jgi:hypothetical protein
MRDVRVDNGHRTEVIGVLSRALDDGRLAVEDHDGRVVAVSTATYVSELLTQVHDLPEDYQWQPHADATPPRATTARTALILGIASVPLAFCGVGAVLGIVAIVLSFRATDHRPGFGPVLLARVFGSTGIVLSAGMVLAVFYVLRQPFS